MSLLIILPTLKEYDNLVRIIPEIFSHVPDAKILIADDHSQDGTNELASENVEILSRVDNFGYGKAVLDGFRYAVAGNFDAVAAMDADFSHDPAVLPEIIRRLSTSDVVIGSRYVAGGGIANWSFHRRLLSRFANWYARSILSVGFRDGTTGFVAYRRSAVEFLLSRKPKSDGYAFLVECKYLLHRADYRIDEYPIVFQDRREGASKMSWKIIWESIWLPWKLRFDIAKRKM